MEHTNCSTSNSCWLPRLFPDLVDERLISRGTIKSLSQQCLFDTYESRYRTQDFTIKRHDSLLFDPTSRRAGSYISNDVYCQGSVINIPFSWEYKPGLSKVTHHRHLHDHDLSKTITKDGIGKLVLQPPPCYYSSTSGDDINVHLSQICAIKPSLRRMSSFRMENTYKEEDPFVEAYKKCTKSPFMILQRSNSKGQKNNNGSWTNIRKYMHIFSCKYAGNVSIDNSVYSYKDVKGVEKIR